MILLALEAIWCFQLIRQMATLFLVPHYSAILVRSQKLRKTPSHGEPWTKKEWKSDDHNEKKNNSKSSKDV